MESFQDGGQQNMNSEHNEYPPTMEGSHMNPEMNNFSPTSGEGSMVSENFSKMPEGMHASQMQNYPGFNRGNYGMADQHGGMMSGNVDYGSQNSQFSGQFSQSAVRPAYPGMTKGGMSPVRPGMMPPGMGMIPGSYSASQRMMSAPGMAQQSGPTPTLNQLLQTPNSGQRFPGNYGDYPAQSKGSDMGAGSSYPMSQGWNGNPRSMGQYPQGSIPGTPYRNQSGGMPETRRPSGMSPGPGPGYPHQNQYISSSMAANAQRYMMGQVRPGQTPMSGHGYGQQMSGPPCGPPHSQMNYPTPMPNPSSQPPSQQQQQQQQQMYHGQQQQPQPPGQPPPQPSPTPSQQQNTPHRPPSSQVASPKQSSPAPPGMADQSSNHSTSSKKSEENTESNIENSNADEGNSENSREAPTLASQSHLGVGAVRPAPSPAGSSGSRSNTPAPASASHSQAGSPMPPRPPSSQLEGQSHLSHSPMATQSFNQQMMPPPMGAQMGYGPGGQGGKMGGPGMTGQMPPHYPQYNSQYPQGAAGNFGRQQGMPGMQGGGTPGSGMPGNYPQSMYNGPGNQMGGMPPGSNSYGMMNRSMQNYNMPYGPGNMNMNSQYGGFSSHMGPGQGPGPGPGPGSGPGPGPGPGHPGMASGSGPVPMPPSQMMASQAGMPPMGAMQQGPGGQMMPGKGAQAAAQAALMAAANSAGTRPLAPGRGSSPRMFGPHSGGSPSSGMMNHMGNLGNPSLNSMSNQINQITSSSVTSVPNKPASPASSGHGPVPSGTNTPTPVDSNNTNGAPPSVGVGSDTANLMSPMSNSDTQESTSRPSSTATPGQTADTTNSTSDTAGSDGSGSMPSSDSTSVDSGFHSAADQNEKPPSESTPNNSSPPSVTQPPSTNGLCEEKTSQDSDKMGVRGDGVSTPSSVHPASTTTAVTTAGTAVTQSITTPVSSEMESSSSQTSMPMPMPMMMSTGVNSSNGPHYPHHPHPHPHPNVGYMGPHGGPGPMGNAHMVPGPGMHHPGMPNNVGNMPYMTQGGMPNNMPPGSMPNNMPPGSMPNNMPPGAMPNAMGPGNMPPGNMPGGMMNNGPSGGLPNNMPPGSMANNISSNAMGPVGSAQNNCIPMPALPDEPPEKKKKDEGVMVSPACSGPGPSYSDDYENCGSPSWPGMPKSAADLSRLYEMGNEMDRRPFLDKLLAFLEEKGTPITSMPSISKQPLDLYRLYHCVREKGGMVEVNKGKKWKEICTYVNIGSSASAAFTLKKNYIRYLFGFECRHDRGNLDPGPILAEMEAQLEKKREQKKRVPSPGSQSSQDAFQPPGTPNSQMMDFPPGPGNMPPPYMQGPGPDGSMGPSPMGGHGPGMMMPNSMNNMMGHPGQMMGSQSNMPPHPGAMGAGPGPGMMGPGGPNSMMMGGSGPMSSGPNQNMPQAGMMNMQGQGGMMNAGNSMMGPNGMMGPGMHSQGMMGPGPNSYVPPTSMMGPNSSSMGPSPGPCPPMMGSSSSSSASSSAAPPSSAANSVANSSSSTSSTGTSAPPTTSNCIPLPPSSTPNSRPPTSDSVSVQDPFADEPSNSPSPAQFPQRPGSTSAPTQPSVSTSSAPMPGFGSRPSSASNSSTSSFPSMPPSSVSASDQATNTFRRPMESFPPTSAAPFAGRPDGAQFPFGQQQYDRERFDPSTSALPGQQFRQSSQPSSMPSSGPADPSYAARFPGQQPPFRPQGEPYGSSQPFGAHGAAFGPRMAGPQEQYPGYQSQQPFSGVRPPPPMGREMPGPYSAPGSAGSQYSDWSGAGMGHTTYSSHLDGPSDSYMSGREGGPWSPMQQQRYPPGSGSNYMAPSAPSTPPMGPYGRPLSHRASPQTRDKFMPTHKIQPKGGSVLPAPQFPTKKEIVFPPDSVEAVQPQLAKRRRLNHKDLGQVEAWRLMMALKSGLLSESTWALDTLNVLLFDDTTVAYFHLSHLPGLLEVLTEHFRASLIRIFSILHDLELTGKRKVLQPCPYQAATEQTEVDASNPSVLNDSIEEHPETPVEGVHCDGSPSPAAAVQDHIARLDSNVPFGNYTAVSRQGKAVKLEENSTDQAVLDEKDWDTFCYFSSGSKHWQKGCGDISLHVVPCFESGITHKLLSELFFCSRTKKCQNGTRDVSDSEVKNQVRKAASDGDVVNSKQSSHSVKTECVKECKQESPETDLEAPVLLKGEKENHSEVCDREVHRNNFMKKLEIKTEPRDSELQRCESDDSLPPPELPAATQDKNANDEGMDGENGEGTKEDAEEKPAPDLTCETDAVQKPSNDGEEGKNTENSKTGESSENSEEKKAEETGSTENTVSPEEQAAMEVEEESAAEAAAAVMKEQDNGLEEEAYHRDDAPLCITQADKEELGRRCVAISNIFRSLSCIPGNEAILSRHCGLMAVLGRLLLLHHWHPTRSRAQPAPPLPKEEEGEEGVEKAVEAEPMEVEECRELVEEDKDWAMSPEWWWETLDAVRENTLVILANICSHMKMQDMEDDVCRPILDGLLHWAVCPSSCACDPLPSASHTSMLSPQRLVLEALCKLCIHDDNVDLLLATPPFSRIILLMSRLIRFLADRSQPVPREFSVVLLSRLVQADPVAARAIALQHPSISLLIDFLESAEQSAMAVASQQGFSVLQSNPEMMGTSLDMLRRAAATLLHLARVPENRKLFLHHQSRLLALVMSQILDTEVTQIVSDVLFECSQSAASQT